MLRRDLLIAGLFGLAGCMMLPSIRGSAVPETLSPPIRLPDGLPKAGWQLAIGLPTTPAQLAGPGIALSRDPFAIEYYDGVAWAEDLPRMIQDLLVAAFTHSGKIMAVETESADFAADFLLETELDEFEAAYWPGGAAPVVNLRIAARLLAMPARQVIGAALPHDAVRARSGKFDDVLAAFNDSLGRVLSKVVVFALTAPGTLPAG
jgi:cholesterol transport system auxiliary component